MTTTRVPAGWYPDPLGDAGTTRRWWNGEMWTEYTAPLSFGSPASGASTPSAAEHGAEPRPTITATGSIVAGTALAPTAHDSALAALAMTLHAGSPATSPWDALPSVSSATVFSPAAVTPASAATGATPIRPATAMSSGPGPRATATGARTTAAAAAVVAPAAEKVGPDAAAAEHPVVVPATRTHTSAIWIMTGMPAVHLLLYVAMATRYPVEAPGWTVALALMLPFVVYAGLADVDARQLGEDGHLRVAPWGLALVMPPLYLLVRAGLLARTRGSAWAPLVVWTVVQLAVLALGLLLAPAALAAVAALIV